MSARLHILSRVKTNQPQHDDQPVPAVVPIRYDDVVGQFKTTLHAIGGSVFETKSIDTIDQFIADCFEDVTEIFSVFPEIKGSYTVEDLLNNPKLLYDMEIAVLQGDFAVAENGAVWITQQNMINRALPFISENLVMVVHRRQIVHTLHEAYLMLAGAPYQYGTFIAGPSKTADIEQSLVLGAHGPKTLSVFILDQ